ncbi:MAG: hypothetical protein KA956_00110 [Pyrinomonadaceae bacterium]|nr:hypothetical protein [Acidobacteriota bacterium]MBK7933299.1 hypothetical protein [Acidobacteriota bacterium]MBP7374853.1 hypothetical protein [Pyrinomonadaceae bacterium]
MNKHGISVIFTLLSLIGVSIGCSLWGSAAKNPVDQLVTLCKDNKLNEAAKHMRYTGTDKSKKDTSANYDTGDADERRQVEMSCKRFKFMSETTYTVSPERMEQGFHVYDVEVKSGSGKVGKELWAFKKTGSDYILVDID